MGKEKEVITGSDQPGWWEDQMKKGRQNYRDSLQEFMDSIVVKDVVGRSHVLSDVQKAEFRMWNEAKEKGYELVFFQGRRGSRLVMKKVYDSMAREIASGGSVVREEVWIKVGNGRAMTRRFEKEWLKSNSSGRA